MLDIAKSRMIWYTVKYNMKRISVCINAGIFQKSVSYPVIFRHDANSAEIRINQEEKGRFMRKLKWIIALIMTAAVMAAVLVFTVSADSDDTVYVSNNSLYQYTLDENKKATILSYSGTESNIIINRIDGKYAIAEIAEGAFAGNENLVSVELYASVKTIGKDAFYGCTNLTTVTLRPNSTLETIGQGAFTGCTKLSGFQLPASLKTIGDEAFRDCTAAAIIFDEATGLESIGDYAFSFCGTGASENVTVTLPQNLTDIGYGAFYGCLNIRAFDISASNPAFSSIDGILYNKDGTVLELYPPARSGSTFTVPSSVKTISGGAFAGAPLESIVVPQGVTEIGGSAFYSAYNLKTVTLPDSLVSLGSYAFLNCEKLEEVLLPESLTDIGTFIFRGCINLKNVKLPSSMTTIPDGLFDSCAALESIELPSGITEIGQFAFNYCTSLKSIQLPAGVKTIKSYAFRNCASLTEIDASMATEIGAFAFQACSKLSKADIRSAGEIPAYLFSGCSLLTDLTFSDSITKIGNYAFLSCDMLPDFTIPESVKSIGDYAFAKCGALAEMTIPATVEKLGMGVFYSSSVTKVTIEAPIKVLPVSFFDGCKKLAYVDLPDTLEVISTGAFSYCVLLTSVLRDSQSVKHVAATAFAGCR